MILKSVLLDRWGRGSSKRACGLIAMGCLVLLTIGNVLTDHKPVDSLVNAFAMIVSVSILGISAERFSKQGDKS